jgi:hypothetical protein
MRVDSITRKADGVVLSREYVEMKLADLRAGSAIRQELANRAKTRLDRVRDNRRSLHCAPPGFPVETRGVDDLHAALFTESRKRGRR